MNRADRTREALGLRLTRYATRTQIKKSDGLALTYTRDHTIHEFATGIKAMTGIEPRTEDIHLTEKNTRLPASLQQAVELVASWKPDTDRAVLIGGPLDGHITTHTEDTPVTETWRGAEYTYVWAGWSNTEEAWAYELNPHEGATA